MASITRTGTRRGRLAPILTATGALVALAGLTPAVRTSATGGAPAGPVRAPASERALVGAAARTDTGPRSLTPGFRLERGRYTTIEVPGATDETGAGGINNRGEIVGGARGGGRPDRGFLRDARGRFSTFRFPGARSTLAQKINDRGQITGYYSNTADDPREGPTAFLLDRGRYTRIAVPGAVMTTAVGINNRTQVVGQYQDADGIFHGYLWRRGRFQTIDAPGAVGTTLFNDTGTITGTYNNPDATPSSPPDSASPTDALPGILGTAP